MNASLAAAIVVSIVIIIAILTNSSYNQGKSLRSSGHVTGPGNASVQPLDQRQDHYSHAQER